MNFMFWKLLKGCHVRLLLCIYKFAKERRVRKIFSVLLLCELNLFLVPSMPTLGSLRVSSVPLYPQQGLTGVLNNPQFRPKGLSCFFFSIPAQTQGSPKVLQCHTGFTHNFLIVSGFLYNKSSEPLKK